MVRRNFGSVEHKGIGVIAPGRVGVQWVAPVVQRNSLIVTVVEGDLRNPQDSEMEHHKFDLGLMLQQQQEDSLLHLQEVASFRDVGSLRELQVQQDYRPWGQSFVEPVALLAGSL